MKTLIAAFLVLGLVMPLTTSAQNKIFPYRYFTDDLPNGLRLITVPTDYPNIVALYIVVGTGSRNEIEPGKSGFAHLFEHLMFRGTDRFPTAKYEDTMKKAGADSNAYTSDDRTVYHTVFSKEDLDQIMMVEADRFQNLKFTIDLFKTETKAVLGEYNKNVASPVRKLDEVLRDTSYQAHTYKHTTMGFLRDIQNFPNMYDYSLEFFKRYYRPEYTTVIVAGDVKHESVVQLVNRYWANWPRGSYVPKIPSEPEQTKELVARVDWPTPTLPWVLVSYKGPAYSDEEKDQATLELISALGFSPNSELYQRLVIKEQKIDTLFSDFEDHRDPYLSSVAARVKDPKDVDYVRNEIIKTFDSFKSTSVPKARLDAVKSNLKYSFALSMDNSEAIASSLAPYISLRRTPETINKVYDLYAAITPEDVQTMARKYFVDRHRTIVTLSNKENGKNAAQ
jgi:zinc protease